MQEQKKYKIVPTLLRILQGGTMATGEIIDIFMSGYGESYRKAKKVIYTAGTSGRRRRHDWGDAYIERQNFYSLLNYLKSQGFIEKKTEEKKTQWRITVRGKEKLKELSTLEKRSYTPEKDSVLRVVVFDIPERDKAKRNWLRGVLEELGFSFLQGSVWIGKKRIPEEFLFELKERELLSYVHIFEVSKEGSIIPPTN